VVAVLLRGELAGVPFADIDLQARDAYVFWRGLVRYLKGLLEELVSLRLARARVSLKTQVRASTRGVLSANPEKETASTGRDRPVRTPVRSVNSPPLLQSKDIPSKASGGPPTRAITIRFSPGKGRMPRAAKSTIW